MTAETTTDEPEDDTTVDDQVAPDAGNDPEDGVDADEQEPETFPRAYVEELRQENGRYRQRAQQSDGYATRLHTELVRATGRLADPTDLPFDEAHLADGAMATAIDELLQKKPHLANRRPTGDIGQGAGGSGGTVDLAAILRQQAQ